METTLNSFTAKLEIIGINPFVFVPEEVLTEIFRQAKRDKSPIPIKGAVNGLAYQQTLMKYKGDWRLYVNLAMLKDSPKRIGEEIRVTVQFDPEKREVPMHPKLTKALKENPKARMAFDKLTPSKRLEILRYMSFLKTDESIERNVKKVIANLQEGLTYNS
ncbi:MAG TPA: YdeI/OmpD-associated family protein [Saprospiraceae bacterium]|nr:YdeI/OmpD-associated family protein [Saprospiraceae bacterium]